MRTHVFSEGLRRGLPVPAQLQWFRGGFEMSEAGEADTVRSAIANWLGWGCEGGGGWARQ